MNNNNLGLYIHIPFCVRKCPYCGFYSAPLRCEEELEAYKDRLVEEIDDFCKAQDVAEKRIVDSIFFGGGTPSIMPTEYIDEILSVINNSFHVTRDCEITLEANPFTMGTVPLANNNEVSGEKFTSGTVPIAHFPAVNRLSIGVQSFDDDVLKTLGRIHTADEAAKAFEMARSDGFDNINLDLMFGIPGQTMGQWTKTLEKAIALNPEHISFYSLQIEEGTPYYKRFMEGEFNELPEELDRDMYHTAIRMLKAAGYKHYEISNAAKPGFECRHNLKYWTGKEYVGFGDSASSYIRADAITDGSKAAESSYIGGMRYTMMNGEKTDVHVNSKFDDMSEYAFTGLRLTSGLNYGAFKSKFGIDFREAFSDRWDELKVFFESGALIQYVDNEGTPVNLVISEQGIDISNKIMAIFV